MSKATNILRIALIAFLAVGLSVAVAGSASAHSVDTSTTEDTSDVNVDLAAQDDNETDDNATDGDGVDFEFDGGDLEVSEDGDVIDFETPEGVDLEIANDSYELEGNDLDYEGDNDADIDAVTDDGDVVEFEFVDGELEDFEVGSTELEISNGVVDLETDEVDLDQSLDDDDDDDDEDNETDV